MKLKLLAFVASTVFIISCSEDHSKFDASGAFETDETVISSEATGVIRQLDLLEGQVLHAGQSVGAVDSTQLILKKKQLREQINAVLSSKPDINAQTAALKEQLRTAEREKQRYANLIQAGAGTQKQLDDIQSQIDVLKRQIAAQESVLEISSRNISKQTAPLEVQMEEVDDMIAKCRIINPVNGTVLTKYAEVSEVTAPGKPLYKIADLSTLYLRAYITGTQLSQVKLSQSVKVLVDDGADKYREYSGVISWISAKAEFTPKTIQTKEERANLVYPVKVKVTNDGSLKIGMYGEMKF
jgi:membrane fusion protein YbhG